MRQAGHMDLRRRLPALVMAVIALALTAVITMRVAAGADSEPQDFTPIVISPAATPTPTPTTTTRPSDDGDDDDDYEREVPPPKDIDDDDDHSGGNDDDSSGRDHPEDD